MFSMSITMLSGWPSVKNKQTIILFRSERYYDQLKVDMKMTNSPTATLVSPGRSINVRFTTAIKYMGNLIYCSLNNLEYEVTAQNH